MNEISRALLNFKRCAEDSPPGWYEEARKLNQVIGEAAEGLMKSLRAQGLQADNSDGIFAIEAAIYDYARKSNPESTLFPCAEAFGELLDGPGREKALADAIAKRDQLTALLANE